MQFNYSSIAMLNHKHLQASMSHRGGSTTIVNAMTVPVILDILSSNAFTSFSLSHLLPSAC
jgi:hypothetical protein